MSFQTNFLDTLNATSSPASAVGATPCASPAGPTIAQYGPAPAPVSRSVLPASNSAPPTPATSGPNLPASSRSAVLQRSLANRLQARLVVYGSPEYELTWKEWAMESGPPICALRASARRTSDNGYSGWPTPCAEDGTKGRDSMEKSVARGAGNLNLPSTAALTDWNTPRATDGSNGGPNQAGGALPADASLAGWPTPMAGNPGTENYNPAGNTDSIRKMVSLAGWLTPCANADAAGNPGAKMQVMLGSQVKLAGSGTISNSSPAPTEKRGALNPAHSRWLQGYPAAWDSCGATAMQSIRNLRRNSSKPAKPK